MKEQERQESLNPRSNLTPTLEISNHRLNPTPTLTTLTQSDHDIIRTFLSSVPLGFPLSPGAALAELTGYAPLSPGLAGLAERSFHPSPSRYESYSDLPISFRSRSVNSPLRIDSPYRSHTGISSPLRISEQGEFQLYVRICLKVIAQNSASPHVSRERFLDPSPLNQFCTCISFLIHL